jgi:FixJ family two-component response regulator
MAKQFRRLKGIRGMRKSRPAPKVFLIDDDDGVRDSLRLVLEIGGFDVEDYGSTAEFTDRCRHPRCGCLILNQHLPVMNGLDFLASPAGRDLGLPVIMVTADDSAATRERARRLGVAAFFDKPVDSDELAAVIGHLIRERQRS